VSPASVLSPGVHYDSYSTGVSPESETIHDHWLRSWYQSKDHFKSRQQAELFNQLAETWLNDLPFTSSLTEMITHPAYLQIIGLGKAVVPLILMELQRRPNHWFTALHAITRDNPLPTEDMGDFQRMTEAWLRWGREHHYIS